MSTTLHTCSYCKIDYPDTIEARFAHNTSPVHRLRLLAATGAPDHVLREAALDAEAELNARFEDGTVNHRDYQFEFAALPHISGEVKIGEPQ